jgi:uncharacterized protein YndB with AHSA1/START domain
MMSPLAHTILPADKPQIITERLLNAPRELVWKVLTEPEHIKHFWGPDGFTNTIRQMDVKPGGQWLFTMHGPDGTDYPNRIIYRTVTPPSYMSWDHDGGEDHPESLRFFGELELFSEGSKTRIQLRLTVSSIGQRDDVAKYAVDGGIQNLERLAAYVAPMAETLNRFVIERSFAVSQTRLFEVCSQVEHLRQWMSPAGMKVIKADQNFKPGGTYHYGLATPDGHEMWGKITYREITPPSKLVYMQSFSDKDGNITSHPMSPTWPKEMVTTFEFIPEGPNQTRLKITWTYAGIDDTEAKTFHAAHAGMTGGWTGSLDQLQAYLAKS